MRNLAVLLALALAAAVPPAATAAGTTIKTGQSRYGQVLFDGKGRSVYLFTKERGSRSRCHGACAKAWPPVLTKGRPRARGRARRSKLGTTRRRGGARQVTYAGRPLYYYVHDVRRLQITCHNVFEFGGGWFVVTPRGSKAPTR